MSKVISLKMNSQFKKLYSKGKSSVRPTMVMYVRRNGTGVRRLGITVGKKLGCAVVRNRAKRKLRELFRAHAEELCGGFDMVLVARGRTASAHHSVLVRDFLTAAAETGVLKDDNKGA